MLVAHRSRRPRGRACLALRALGLVLLLGLLGARSARAELRATAPPAAGSVQASTAGTRAAQQLFKDAAQDRDAGLLARAEEKLREALQLWDHPVIRYDLAIVLVERDNPIEAADHLREVIERGPETPGTDPTMIEDARKMLGDLTQHHLATVVVTCRTEGAAVYIDDKPVFTVGKLPKVQHGLDATRVRTVRAGGHMFVAVMPGQAPVAVWRSVAPGKQLHIELAAPRTYRRRWPHLTWAPWAAIGGGVVLWVAGAALQANARVSYLRFDHEFERCTNDGNPCALGPFMHLNDRGDTLRSIGLASYGLAAAAIITGGVLAYLNRPIPHRTATVVGPLVGPGLGGAAVLGRF